MNEEAIKHAYSLFTSDGYTGSYDQFKQLIQTNQDAKKHAYSLFTSDGYRGAESDFDTLIGSGSAIPSTVAQEPVKKKEESLQLPWTEKPKQQKSQEKLSPFLESIASERSLESRGVPDIKPLIPTAPSTPDDKLDEMLSKIDTSLVDMDEEQAKEKLKYLFGDLGFGFEEAGFGYDAIKVTSPTGKTLDLSWDTFTQSGDKAVLDKLKNFVTTEGKAPANIKNLQNFYDESNKKFVNQQEVDDAIASLSKQEDEFNQFIKTYSLQGETLKKTYDDLLAMPQSRKPADYNERLQKVQSQIESLEQQRVAMLGKYNNYEATKSQINKSVGKYVETQEKMGWWGGVLLDSFLKGQGRVASSATGTIIDALVGLMPTESLTGDYPERFVDAAKKLGYKESNYNKLKASLSAEQIDDINDKVDDELKKQLKYQYGTLETAREAPVKTYGSDQVTEEFKNKFKEGFWGGAIAGLAESLPSMLGPSTARVVKMYAQITDNVDEEMQKDPELSKLSENEKLLVKVPIGIASAVLEEFGLRNVIANKGLLNSLTVRALGRSGTTTTARSFADLVRNDVKSMLAKGALTLAGAGLAEFETGALQEASEQGVKFVYNKVKGERLFDRIAETPGDLIKDMLYAGAQEAVGGLILGTIPAVSAAYRKTGFEGMSDSEFAMFEEIANDEKIESAFVTSLKAKVNSGEISLQEGKDLLNDYRNARSVYVQLPDDLSVENKKKAMNLLRERKAIESSIQGKDEALVKSQKSRIQEINNQLEQLSKPENNAIQESSTEESVLRPEESQLGLQEVGEGPKKLSKKPNRK